MPLSGDSANGRDWYKILGFGPQTWPQIGTTRPRFSLGPLFFAMGQLQIEFDVEVWKAIPGFEGYYEVGHNGVRSIGRWIEYSQNGKIYKQFCKEHCMKLSIGSHGYYTVRLYKKGIGETFLFHRLKAEAFLPKVEGKDQINHKSGIKTDNRLENLEWCTRSENMKHAYDTKLRLPQKGSENARSKAVGQYTKEGVLVARFGSALEAYRQTGVSSAGISLTISGVQSHAGGFVWKFVDYCSSEGV